MLLVTKSINSKTDFLKGSVLLFNKPVGWSSFDVVKKVRSLIKKNRGFKKIKVGHAGTLDPLAEGLLIICTGKFTKKISSIQKMKKTYTGTIFLGATTPSYDKETEVNSKSDVSYITNQLIDKKRKDFEGEIMQTPPIFSALKKDGLRLYEYARKGIDLEISERLVKIHYFKVTEINVPVISFEVQCGSGTYIRSLAHEFGQSLKCGGYLSSLKRKKIGNYHLSNSFSIQEFESLL